MKKLVSWSLKEYSHLPWRQKRSLYTTLVSEIMLQQTTVSTVKGKFSQFILQFPDLESLANASEEEMLIAWKGLGYYRRAKNLRLAAAYFVKHFAGEIPLNKELLLKVPGIGEYTASALIAIGANQPEIAIDANIERVLARIWGLDFEKGKRLQLEIKKKIFEIGELKKELKLFGARAINEALMDVGRVYCKAREAHCIECPLSKQCLSAFSPKRLNRPQMPLKKAMKEELTLLRVYVLRESKILVYQKGKGQWLEGQFEVPTFILNSSDKKLVQYPKLSKSKINRLLKKSQKFKSSITKYTIENLCITVSYQEYEKHFSSIKAKFINCANTNLSTATLKGLILLAPRQCESKT